MRRFALPLLEQTNRNMTMPRRHSKWQIGGTRGAFLLLHGLLCGSIFLAFAAPVQAQPCLYVVNQLRGAVEAFRRPELSLVASVGLTECVLPQCMPTALAVDTGRLRAYVTRQDAGSVQVIDMTGGHAPVRIAVGVSPSDLVLNSDGSRLYVANLATDTVSVIDTNLDAVIDTIPVGDGPRGLAIRPDNSRVYVANANDDTVSVIDTGTDDRHRHAHHRRRRRTGRRPAHPGRHPALRQQPEDRDRVGRRARRRPGSLESRSAAGPRAIAFAPEAPPRSSPTRSTARCRRSIPPTETAGDPIAVGRGPIDVVDHRRRQHRLRRQPLRQHAVDPRRRERRRDDPDQSGRAVRPRPRQLPAAADADRDRHRHAGAERHADAGRRLRRRLQRRRHGRDRRADHRRQHRPRQQPPSAAARRSTSTATAMVGINELIAAVNAALNGC